MRGSSPSSRRLPHLLGEDLQAHKVDQVISFDYLSEEADVYNPITPTFFPFFAFALSHPKRMAGIYCYNTSSIFCYYCIM